MRENILSAGIIGTIPFPVQWISRFGRYIIRLLMRIKVVLLQIFPYFCIFLSVWHHLICHTFHLFARAFRNFRTSKNKICRTSENREEKHKKNPRHFIWGPHIFVCYIQSKCNRHNLQAHIYRWVCCCRTVDQINKPSKLQYDNQCTNH